MKNYYCIAILIFLFARELLVAVSEKSNVAMTGEPKELPMHEGSVKVIRHGAKDVFDCVDFYQQPAFRNPLLKDHKPELRWGEGIHVPPHNMSKSIFSDAWFNNQTCPKGTVPIKRSDPNMDLDFLRQIKRQQFLRSNNVNTTTGGRDLARFHEYAIIRTKRGMYYQTKFKFTIWNPSVERGEEFSLGQVWLTNQQVPHYLNSIEVGWIVYERIYGDRQTRLFVYWTNDDYRSTGCYDTNCRGFVQVSQRVLVGAPIPTSVFNGQQHEVELTIARSKYSQKWWLLVDGEQVGYWPPEILPTLGDFAEQISWGGEVVNFARTGRHTSTKMGSGHFPGFGRRKAAYFQSIRVSNTNEEGDFRDVESYEIEHPLGITNLRCYDLKLNGQGLEGTHFSYGGPGYSPLCQ